MDVNDFIDAGNDIVDVVNEAIKKNDYSKLSDTIQKTVSDVTEAAKKDIRYGAYGRGSTTGRTTRTTYENRRTVYTKPGSTENAAQRQGRQKVRYRASASNFLQKNISKSKGNGLIGLGIFGLISGLTMIVDELPAIASGGLSDIVVGVAIAVLSAYALVRGRKDHTLAQRYYRYGEIVGDAQYIEIEELAQRSGRTREEVLADIRTMMQKGYLNEAWLDEQETTLMLTPEIYDQYREIRTNMAQMQRQDQEERAKRSSDGLSEEVRALLSEGNNYIASIHRLNDDIADEEMTDKLSRLETTMNRIMEQVRKNPDSASDLRRLMNYYLPTTMKLLHAYKELDRQSSNGENVVNTKREIEGALDTINDAFEKLLDDLFQHMAWDISSDISVMETMMKQDGLTGTEMHAQSEDFGEKGSYEGDLWSDSYTSTLSFGDEDAQVQYKK